MLGKSAFFSNDRASGDGAIRDVPRLGNALRPEAHLILVDPNQVLGNMHLDLDQSHQDLVGVHRIRRQMPPILARVHQEFVEAYRELARASQKLGRVSKKLGSRAEASMAGGQNRRNFLTRRIQERQFPLARRTGRAAGPAVAITSP